MDRLEKIEQLKEEFKSRDNSVTLTISRFPKPTFLSFKEFADREFAGDYGMLTKMLWDCFNGLITTGTEHLEAEIISIRNELESIKAQLNKEETPKARMSLSGKRIG